jgi:prophage maintenance system killer protein
VTIRYYPDFVDKAAVLIVRLARNHQLPDGNERAAWVALRLVVETDGWKLAAERPAFRFAGDAGQASRPRQPLLPLLRGKARG